MQTFDILGSMKSSKLSIASLSLSCISLVLGLYGAITAFSGIVCGHIALKNIKNDPHILGAKKAKAGLIIGYIYIGLVLLLLIIPMIWVTTSVMQKEDMTFPRPKEQTQEIQDQTNNLFHQNSNPSK